MSLSALCETQKKMFKPNPRLLYCRHTISLANCQPILARPVEYDISDIDRLELRLQCPHDVGKLEEFLNCGELDQNWVARVVNVFFQDVLPFKELVRHQLTVINRVRCPVVDIFQLRCLYRAKTLLDESLFHSHHLTEQTHFLGVHDPHIGVRVRGRAVWNDERTRVIQVNKNIG